MFSRVRKAVDTLRAPTESEHLERTVPPDTLEEARGEALPNPALKLIAVTIVVLFCGWVLAPLLHRVLTIQERTTTVLVSALSVLLSALWARMVHAHLERHLLSVVKLDFLAPYFGRRLNRTYRILKGQGA